MKTQTKYISVISALLIGTGISAQTLQDAIRLTDDEQFPKAKTTFDQLVAKDPTNGDNFFYYGDLLLKSDDPEGAKAQFQKGIDINATNPLVHIGMARYSLSSGKADDGMKEIAYAQALIATEVGKKGTTLTPQRQAQLDLEMAKSLLAATAPDFQAALDLTAKAEKLDPKNPDVFLTRGDILYKKNPVEGSAPVTNYTNAAKLDAKSCKAYVRIGNLYANGKNMQSAIGYYNLALKIDSTFAPAYRLRGEAQYQIGKFDSASYSYSKYLALNPDCYSRYRYCAFLYKSGDFDNSIKQGQQVLQCDSTISVVYRIVGRSYLDMKTPDAAKCVDYFNKFFAKQKLYGKPALLADDYIYRARGYAKQNMDSLAIMDYEAGLKTDTSRKDIYFELGGEYFKMKKYDQAAATYKKKIDGNPAKANISDYNAYGRSLFLQKDYVNADSAFKKVCVLDPKNPIGWYWRGRCNASLDPDVKSDSARKFYEAFYDLAIADKDKNKKELIVAGKYFASYNYIRKNYACSKAWFQFVLELDPNDGNVKSQLDTDKSLKAVAAASDLSTCRMGK
ncbi:MAG: hypothetical protein HY064_13415 [Bacteroidetes bacterium]|nr:hypothetical protein [Bacteroidota bacterium]